MTFTLKHIDLDGREAVVSLASVSFDPETKVLVGHAPGGDRQWTRGRAFLMNDQGKTVATYVLNQKQEHTP